MQKEKQDRLLYIDNIRLFLIILVILIHISIIYGGEGIYPAKEGATDEISPIILTLFNTICQSFFMGLFFLLSGYFTPWSFDRKGAKKFLRDRLIRLGIPLLVYTTVFKVVIEYLILNFFRNTEITFTEVIAYNLKNPGWFIGPLWFVEALLIFCLVYVLYRISVNKSFNPFNKKFPSNKAIFISILLLAILTFFVRIFFAVGEEIHIFQLAHFVNYIFCFWLGVLAYRRNWLDNLRAKQARTWKIIAVLILIALPFIFVFGNAAESTEKFTGGFTWQSLVYSLWETIACYSIIISLISVFKKRFNSQGNLVAWMAPNFYVVYIIHQLVILPLAIIFQSIFIPSYVKFIFVSILGVALCFAIGGLIRKIKFTRKVLG
ncbi:hypothetical protein A3K73_01885 [Candidatus Pacearchaeota archaeon RBG_13_36_9]|nr:MAG: hypothetical protein A3K73_01885 [Candidatus Pacearchaeota archaeon RBG_13_36_9]